MSKGKPVAETVDSIHVTVPADLKRSLDKLSAKEGAPVAWYIRQALSLYLRTRGL